MRVVFLGVYLALTLSACTDNAGSSRGVASGSVTFTLQAPKSGIQTQSLSKQATNSASTPATSTDYPNLVRVRLSVKNTATGALLFNSKEITLRTLGGYYISEPVSMPVGSYQITEFIVIDKSGNAAYATPIASGDYSASVKSPLPIALSVAAGKAITATPEVIKTSGKSPASFGASGFSFSVVDAVPSFGVSVFVPSASSIAWDYTTASTVSVSRSDGVVVLEKALSEKVNYLYIPTVSDGEIYTFKFSQPGYAASVKLGAADLSKYELQPLDVILEVLPIASSLNDTGALFNMSGIGCSVEDSQEDCSQGRDALFAAGGLKKIGGGVGGFDFTKLGMGGAVLENQNNDWSSSGNESLGSKWSCVRDNVTGLIWEVKTTDSGPKIYTNFDDPSKSQIRGSKPTSDQVQNESNAVGYASAMNAIGMCGYKDWRIPSDLELHSIVNFGDSKKRFIDAAYFPNTMANKYWTSTPFAGADSQAWFIDFGRGYVLNEFFPGIEDEYQDYTRSTRLGVMLVRGTPMPRAKYEVSADGTEVISSFGLVWKRCLEGQNWSGSTCVGSPSGMNWVSAILLAKEAASNEGKKWRLPNAKELRTLIDINRGSPLMNPVKGLLTIDPVFFPNEVPFDLDQNQYTLHWSSTPSPYAFGPTIPVAVSFARNGAVIVYLPDWTNAYFRLVRDR